LLPLGFEPGLASRCTNHYSLQTCN